MNSDNLIDGVIWAEVYRLKFLERYLGSYLDVLKCRRKWVHVLSICFSAGGLFGNVLWEYALFTGVLAALAVQIFALLQEYFIMSQTDLAKVMDLRILCVNSFNKFEKLYLKKWYNKITEENAIDEFYDIRAEFSDIHRLFNVLDLPERKKDTLKAAREAMAYIGDTFNLPEETVAEASKKIRKF